MAEIRSTDPSRERGVETSITEPRLGVIVIDDKLRIQFASAYAAAFIGDRNADLRQLPFLECFPPDEPELRSKLSGALGSAVSLYYSTTLPRASGRMLRISFRVQGVDRGEGHGGASAILVAVSAESLQSEDAPKLGSVEERFRSTYSHTSLTYADASTLYDALENLMNEEQLYLDKAVDLEAVCRKLHTNQLYLSQVVNFFAEENFRDYLNRKRVVYLQEHATEVRDLSIGEIWRAAGFGSYSAFRRFLHASRDLTPGAFVRSLRRPLVLNLD